MAQQSQEPRLHRVQRGSGHDEQPEHHDQQEDRQREVGGERALQRRSREHTEHTTRTTSTRAVRRVAMHQVQRAEQPDRDSDPADRSAALRCVGGRCAQQSPRRDRQHDRQEHDGGSDEAAQGDSDAVPERSSRRRPRADGDYERAGKTGETQPVAPVRGVQLARTTAEVPGHSADDVRQQHPQPGEQPTYRAQQSRGKPWTAAAYRWLASGGPASG